MLRRFALAIVVLASASAPAVAQTPASSHAQVHAMLMSGTPIDSAQCAMLHSAMREHFGSLPLDSTQKIALHTIILSQAGVVHLDSTQLSSLHTTMHRAIDSGALDADHVKMLHTMLSDSTHLAVIRSCFAEHMGGTPDAAPRRH